VPKKINKITVRLSQVLIILIPVVLFFHLLNIATVPSGTFVTSRVVNETSPYLDRLLPDARVERPVQEGDGDWLQKIVGDPVFFFVHPQRSFSLVETELRFKNTGVPIVELGVLADATTGAYSLEPLQNLIIDNSPWFKIEDNGTVLLQRNKKFDSIEEFLTNLPARSEVAAYHYDLSEPYRQSDYFPSSGVKTTRFFLRGSQEFYTYLKNEALNFKFGFLDENNRLGADEVDIVVINEAGQPVAEERMTDDGNVSDDGSSSWPQTLEIVLADLPEGVYKIQMKATEDIVFRFISTRQRKMVFLNQLWLTSGGDYPTDAPGVNLVTGGRKISLATHYASGAQTVLINQEPLIVAEPYLEYFYNSTAASLTKISILKNEDLLVKSDNPLAFSSDQYFNPNPLRLTAEIDLDRLGVNYIIADYSSPRQDGEWTIATATLDTSKVSFDEKTWKFVISAPTAGQANRELFINSIKMTFKGLPLTFKDFLNKSFSYVLEKIRKF